MVDAAGFRAPIGWADLQPDEYDGMILPGGHAPGMRQYLGSDVLRDKVAQFWALRRPVGAICHGVLVLARTRDPATGRSVIAACRTTCLPKYMERGAYTVLTAAGVRVLKTPPRAPKANAYAERWVRTVRTECLDRTLIWSRRHLEQVLIEYLRHYNTARPRGVNLQAPVIEAPQPSAEITRLRRVERTDVLDGLIHEYRHAA